jgi:hypothetical protein
MSRKKQLSLSGDERIGQQVEDELSSSSSSSDSSSEEVREPKRTKMTQQTVPQGRARIAASQRLEIIAKKMQGIEDPQFKCIQNTRTKSWVVRKRKFPLDQTPKVDAHSGKVPNSPLVPVVPETPSHSSNEVPVSWLNMQATVNDSLQKTIEKLSANYDKLSEKYVEGKKRPKKETKTEKPAHKPKTPVPDDADEEDRRLTETLRSEYFRQLELLKAEAHQPAAVAPAQRPAPPPRKQYGKYPNRVSIFSY